MKNEPLQFVRTIFKVLPIVFFLFFITLPAGAVEINTAQPYRTGTVYATGGTWTDVVNGTGLASSWYEVAPEIGGSLTETCATYKNRRGIFYYKPIPNEVFVNWPNVSFWFYYNSANSSLQHEKYYLYATSAPNNDAPLQNEYYHMTRKGIKISEKSFYPPDVGSYRGMIDFPINTQGKVFLSERAALPAFIYMTSDDDVLQTAPNCGTDILYVDGINWEGGFPEQHPPYLRYDNLYEGETPTINYLNNDCCADQSCRVPIIFDEYFNNAILNIEIDPDGMICNAENTPDSSYTLDSFNNTPEEIVLSSQSSGDHLVCAWTSEIMTYFTASYRSGTSSPYCIIPEITAAPEFCSDEALGCGAYSSSTSLWEGLICGLKQAGCWFVVPATSSLQMINDNAKKLQTKFPFNLYFGVLNDLEYGFSTTSDSRAGGLSVPMYSASSSSFYFIPIVDASSTENAIGKINASLFRRTQTWIIWGAVGLYLLLRLRPKQKET